MRESKYLAILLAMVVSMVILYGQIDYRAERFSDWDLNSYQRMASVSPGVNCEISRPFSFRLLGPYIVGLLPFSQPAGFYGLAVIFSILLAFQLYFLLRFMKLPPAISTVTVTLFLFNRYWFGFNVWNYFQLNDLLTLTFLIVLLWSLWTDRWVVFGLTFLLGVLSREVALLMAPVAFAYAWEKKDLSRTWQKMFLAIVPGLVAFVLIRNFIPSVGGNSLFDAFLTYARKVASPEGFYRLFINSPTPFSLLPLVFYETTLKFFRTRKYMLLFVCLVVLSTMFGSNNERLMAPAFIVMYPLIGIILHELRPNKTFLAILILAGFVSSFHHLYGRYVLPSPSVTVAIYMGSLVMVTLPAVAYRLSCLATSKRTALDTVSGSIFRNLEPVVGPQTSSAPLFPLGLLRQGSPDGTPALIASRR